jgi:hypothetical protein
MDAIGPLFLLMWIASSFLVAYVGSENNRNYFAWLAIAIFFSPLIGLLALAALPESSNAKAPAIDGFKMPSSQKSQMYEIR